MRNRTLDRLNDIARRHGAEVEQTKHGHIMRIRGVIPKHDLAHSRSGYHSDGSPRSKETYTNSRDHLRS